MRIRPIAIAVAAVTAIIIPAGAASAAPNGPEDATVTVTCPGMAPVQIATPPNDAQWTPGFFGKQVFVPIAFTMGSDSHTIAQNEHKGGSHTLVTCDLVIEAGTYVGRGTVTGFFTGTP